MQRRLRRLAAHRVFSSALWSNLNNLLEIAFNFAVFAVLARLLGAADIGLVAIASVFVQLVRTATQTGLAETVIQRETLDEDHVHTAFWANVGSGLILALVLVLIARPLAWVFGTERLAPVLMALALVPVLSSASAIQLGILQREFRFRLTTIVQLASNLGGGAVGIAAGLHGFGVWSLVLQQIVQQALMSLLVVIGSRYRPRLVFDRAWLASSWGFSGQLMATNLLHTVGQRVFDLAIGLFVSVEAAGYFRVAMRGLDLITNLTIMPFRRLALPIFARQQHDPALVAQSFTDIVEAIGLFTFPTFLLVFLLADQIVPLLFGAQWGPSAEILRWLSLIVVTHTIVIFINPALAAVGRGDLTVWLTCLQIASQLLVTAAVAPFGVVAIAISHPLRALATMPMFLSAMRRVTGLAPLAPMAAILPAFTAGLVMVAVGWVLKAEVIDASRLPGFLLVAGAAAITYLLVLGLVFRPRLTAFAGRFRLFLRRTA